MSNQTLAAQRALARAQRREKKKTPKMKVSGKSVLQVKRLREGKG